MRSRYLAICLGRALVIALAGWAILATPASAAFNPQSKAAVELADTYAPIAEIDAQKKPCGPGEAYRSTVVDLILGNPEVVLRNVSGKVVLRAPTAQDLARAPDTDYIDLPGNPLTPGCFYEKQFRRWYGHRMPSVYAHVGADSEHPGKLAVQYWFYYTFNDFTDKHESDWEMAQVDFDAPTPQQALKTGPYQVDEAQHSGGESGAWNDDPKLTKVGTHFVTNVSTGSQSDYFQRDLYLGKGGSAVFGCEDTRNNTTRLTLHPVVLPNTPVPANSQFAWLDFPGRWGQRESGINNGPLGPAYHEEWLHPITWADGLRTSSVTVPDVKVLGLSATSFFCTGTTDTALAIDWGTAHPWLFLGLLAVLLFLLGATARITRWSPPEPWPLRERRGGGQILRGARRLYGEHPLTFIGIGLIFIPVSVFAGAVQWVLFHLTGIDRFVALDGRSGAGTTFLALLIGGLAGAFAAAAVTAAVSAALNEIDAGRPVTAIQAYVIAVRRLRALSGATAFEFVVLVVLTLLVVGIPFAIYGFIRTSLFAQACVLEDQNAVGALQTSAKLTRGRWWRTFGFTAVVDIVAILSGPILGVLILLLTAQSLTFINIASSIVYALTVPYAAIALTLYYFDLQARSSEPQARGMRASGIVSPTGGPAA